MPFCETKPRRCLVSIARCLGSIRQSKMHTGIADRNVPTIAPTPELEYEHGREAVPAWYRRRHGRHRGSCRQRLFRPCRGLIKTDPHARERKATLETMFQLLGELAQVIKPGRKELIKSG